MEDAKMKLIDSIKRDFTTRTLVLIPVAIAINIVIGQLVIILKLPIYLDSIGTVLVGAIAGPWAGALTGALGNLIWGTVNAYLPPFFYVAAVIGAMAGIAARMGVFKRSSPRWLSTLIGGLFFFGLTLFILSITSFSRDEIIPNAADLIRQYAYAFIILVIIGLAIGYFFLQKAGYAGLAGLVTGVVAAIISAPTAAIVFGGVTGAGTDLLVAAFRASGSGILASTLAQGAVSDPFDKMASFLIVWLIIQSLPTRFTAR
jgi:energy-coupling factor transport system substrate-specific component